MLGTRFSAPTAPLSAAAHHRNGAKGTPDARAVKAIAKRSEDASALAG